jgi:hypothetical protein
MVVFSPAGAAASLPPDVAGAAVGAHAAKISGVAVAAAICKNVRLDSLVGRASIVFLLTPDKKGEIE